MQARGGKRRFPHAKVQATAAACLLFALVASPFLSLPTSAAPLSGWQGAEIIELYNQSDAVTPDVASNAGGVIMAVWTMADGSHRSIWSNLYAPGTGWKWPVVVESDDSEDAAFPSIALDGNGNAVAVWQQNDTTRDNIWANVFDPSSGWGTPELIEKDDAGSALQPQVSIDGTGHAFAVWRQSNGTDFDIWGNTFELGTGWAGATTLDGRAGDPDDPQVGAYGDGNAVAAWSQFDGTRNNIYYSDYTAGSGWAADGLAERNNSGPAVNMQLDVDVDGNAAVVWDSGDLGSRNVSANYRTAGSGWASATLLGVGTDVGRGPHVALDAQGNGFAVWAQRQTPSGDYNIAASQYTRNVGWGTEFFIEDDSHLVGLNPRVDADGSLHAVAVWSQANGIEIEVGARERSGTSGWGALSILGAGVHDLGLPRVVVNGNGDAVAYWVRTDATRESVWSNRLVQPDTTAPSLFLASPANGTVTNLSAVAVYGTTDGAQSVSVNGLVAVLAANGSFSISLGLLAGLNLIVVTATDPSGNAATARVNVTFVDPALQRIADLEAQNAALKAQLNLTNSSLWQALAGVDGSIVAALVAQNASIAAALASQNASLLAALAAQNASLVQAIADLNASLLASLAAQDASLLQVIASTNASLALQLASLNASLLAQLASTNASLLSVIASQNASLLASLAAQNASLSQLIATTNASLTLQLASLNASLLAQLASTNASLVGQIASQNASLLASLAAQNTSLAQLIASTNASMALQLASLNASLLAQLASTNASLLSAMASQNASLLASLAAQDASLRQLIANTNASLTLQLASLNASLLAQLAATDTSLLNLLASQNASLLASLAAQDASLRQLIGAVNASLLASLAGQNSALLATIAATNASLFAAMAAQNLSLLSELASLDAALAAQIVAGDAQLAADLAALNQSLLAKLAALNATLRAELAATDSSLLASLAAQDATLRDSIRDTNASLLASLLTLSDDLMNQIAAQDASLLARLASQNATLWARLTADNGALWAALNASGTGGGGADPAIDASQAEAAAARNAAASASTLGTLGLLAGIAGAAIGLAGMRSGRKGGRSPPEAPTPVTAQAGDPAEGAGRQP